MGTILTHYLWYCQQKIFYLQLFFLNPTQPFQHPQNKVEEKSLFGSIFPCFFSHKKVKTKNIQKTLNLHFIVFVQLFQEDILFA